jgi:dolichol-phosphate mannosyltransferase
LFGWHGTILPLSAIALPMRSATPRYSFIIPVCNEEEVLPQLLSRMEEILDRLDSDAEVIFVDDGSRDLSPLMLDAAARKDPRYKALHLSRNFGHQIAITAGMDMALGKAVIVMDADLQDPPDVALKLIEAWKGGNDIVYAQRISRDGETWLKKFTAHVFYRLLRQLTRVDIPRDTGDFRLIDRKVLEAFRRMPERDRFVRGMFGWLGFRQAAVQFAREPRAGGKTKYSVAKMIRLAFDGVFGFSDLPLRLALWLGFAVSAAALLYGAYVVALRIFAGDMVDGWASTVVILSLLGGMNLMMTGIVGIYVGRIHTEVKARPLYIIDRAIGFEANAAEVSQRDELPFEWKAQQTA